MSKASRRPIVVTALLGIGGLVAGCLGFSSIFHSNVSTETELTNWMSKIDDEKKINELSIPGTHNSGALYSVIDISGKCQDSNLYEQLQIGVRYFEFRLQYIQGSLHVMHGVSDESLTFDTSVKTLTDFLDSHPNEFLFVSVIDALIKEEGTDTEGFEGYVRSAISSSDPNGRWVTDSSSWPNTVGEARGKIYQLSRYRDPTFGFDASYELDAEGQEVLKWPDYSAADSHTFDIAGNNWNLHIQDYYRANDLETKENEITACLDYVNGDKEIKLNYTSAYIVNSFPPSYVPSISAAVNEWILEELPKQSRPVGFLIGDFVTTKYTSAVIERNGQ